MTRRLTARGEQRRAELMRYATRLFAEHGFHPTSIAQIVSGINVGKGVFYWYFSSKDQLLVEILAEAQRDLRRRQQQVIGDEADPVRRIELGIRASMAWLADNRDLASLFQFAATEERFAPYLRQGQQVVLAEVVRHVEQGIDAGRVRAADPVVLTHAILGVTDHLARTFVVERGDPPDAVADAAVAFCLGGLLGRPAPVPAGAAGPSAWR